MIDRILKTYDTSVHGLSDEEVEKRRLEYGPNELYEKERDSALKLFLSQFYDALIFLLIIAAVISFLIGDYIDAGFIAFVVILNAVIGFIQENRAENAMEELKKLTTTTAIVRRNDQISEIPMDELTIGDIVVLEEGCKVPADILLIENYDLKVDESLLTGESDAVSKDLDYEKIENLDEKLKDIQKHYSDDDLHGKMTFMDSTVVSGRAIGVVGAIGMKTFIGSIAELIQQEEGDTQLQKNVSKIGKLISEIAIIVCIGVFFIDYYHGMPIVSSFMTAVTLAVAAIPEGLPAVLTLTLALGMQKLSRSKAIVRKLWSVESLGSCSVIASDKTGTLTENRMTVTETFFTNKAKTLLIASLNNNATIKDDEVIGDPTDGAIIEFANKNDHYRADLEIEHERIVEIPVDSIRKRMTTVNSNGENAYVLSKGAPELILDSCKYVDDDGDVIILDDEFRKAIASNIQNMTNNALRVIGFAYKEIEWDDQANADYDENLENDMIFTGLMGMMDPPRKEVKKAIQECKKAGISTIMITGDHQATAKAIAQEIGLFDSSKNIDNQIITGKELNGLSDDEYEKIADEIRVYARVFPEQKMRIVEVLQNKGNIVSMTGDGVNDAPALKKADIGVSMGSGTDVAKESSDIVIQDDNFATIVKSIKQGRTIFDNLKRFLKFQLSTNIGAILTITTASILPIPTPFTPIQLLWINIIMDGPPAQSLGLEGPEKNIMNRPPENGDLINRKALIKILVAGCVMTIGSILLYYYELISGSSTAKAMTVIFTVFVVYQLFNAYNNKSDSEVKNNLFWISIIGSFILQVIVIYLPFLQGIFHTASIDIMDWILIFAVSITILISHNIMERLVKD